MRNIRGLLLLVISTFAISLLVASVSAVTPFGANYTGEVTTTSSPDSPEDHDALAGNVSEIIVTGYSRTQTWQGYYGNVTGTVQLADSNDKVMYNWSLASPEGEIYAVNNSGISWTNVQCFNFTANGSLADDSSQRGGTSLYGMNLTTLESMYSIVSDDVDGIDETFNVALGAGGHDAFFTNNLQFTEGECRNTRVYNSSGKGDNDVFEEVLLYDPTNKLVIFTSILDEESPAGFDARQHDFEMLVLENGHGTDVATTKYYFYVELE